MSLSADLAEMRREVEKVRREQGEEAAREFEKKQNASYLGGTIGLNGGVIAGALIGSAILPGVGSVIGGVVGGFVGLTSGVKDENAADNARTAWGVVSSVVRGFRS